MRKYSAERRPLPCFATGETTPCIHPPFCSTVLFKDSPLFLNHPVCMYSKKCAALIRNSNKINWPQCHLNEIFLAAKNTWNWKKLFKKKDTWKASIPGGFASLMTRRTLISLFSMATELKKKSQEGWSVENSLFPQFHWPLPNKAKTRTRKSRKCKSRVGKRYVCHEASPRRRRHSLNERREKETERIINREDREAVRSRGIRMISPTERSFTWSGTVGCSCARYRVHCVHALGSQHPINMNDRGMFMIMKSSAAHAGASNRDGL